MWLTFQVPFQNNDTMGRECISWNTEYKKQKTFGTCNLLYQQFIACSEIINGDYAAALNSLFWWN